MVLGIEAWLLELGVSVAVAAVGEVAAGVSVIVAGAS
jgi:hypothetical protein